MGSRGEVCKHMRRTIQWAGDEGCVEWREVKVFCSVKGLRKGCPLLPLLYLLDGNGRGICVRVEDEV